MRVYDSAGAWLAENDDGIGLGTELDSGLTFTATIADAYYLEAGAFQDGYAGAYGVTVSLQVVPSDDFADSLTDAAVAFGQVSVSTPSTGNLEVVGDHDWFAIQLTSNTSYTIDLSGEESGGGTLEDPYLRVYDSAGALLVENDDTVPGTSHDSRLTYHVTATGTYYVAAGAYNDLYTGTYRVSVAMGGVAPAGSDFNGDGFSDILWQNADGQVQISVLNGASIIAGGTVGGNPGPSWYAIGTGDFNGDGKSDILFQHTNGWVGLWELNGTVVIDGPGTFVGNNPGPSWRAVGTGDFNGDGKSDILFQHTNGPVGLWELVGTNVIGGSGMIVAEADSDWIVV